ncbi:hypothetical protein A1OK_02965 [Enterovibrio norvegicus FF-454]|uniref:Uncharacterized protein n=1 Tax=Enterovibrio norvegicus FF-454 TaxID=1185651 RepID=A0A1E5C0F2_9GAMM|nr:hypothetical protein [Enterovibrio norvegicus]OEE58983.1 hypothetical protein A1OK_02965 [Enterovibrio norvegicus FF-454]
MEYANEYTKKEKLVRFSLLALFGIVAVVANNVWLQPLLTDFDEHPHCYELFGLNGADTIWHLLFVGLPVSLFLITSFMPPTGIAGLKEGRYPPRAMKVYKPTVVKTGVTAYLRSSVLLLLPLFVLLVAVWGSQQVDKMPVIDKERLGVHLCSKT